MDAVPSAETADARNNMVDGQLRPNRVTDRRLLAALRVVAREEYVDPGQRALAYADATVPMAGGRMMPAPLTTARMIQALELAPGARVLVLGAGYAAAVLLAMGMRVTVLDEAAPGDALPGAAALARDGAALRTGPMRAGWPADGPYDAILVDGAVTELPPLGAQLAPAGRLCTIRTLAGGMGVAVLAETRGGGWSERVLFDCAAPALAGLSAGRGFHFPGRDERRG